MARLSLTTNCPNVNRCKPLCKKQQIGNKAAHIHYGNVQRDEDISRTKLILGLPSGLRCVHWNIQSIKNNIDQVKNTFESQKGNQVDILGISETWLDDSYSK